MSPPVSPPLSPGTWRRALLLCGLALPLALLGACGKKGDLRPPPGEAAAFTWPKQYPAPRTVVPGEAAEEEQEPVRPDSGFAEPNRGFLAPSALPSRGTDRSTRRVYRSQ